MVSFDMFRRNASRMTTTRNLDNAITRQLNITSPPIRLAEEVFKVSVIFKFRIFLLILRFLGSSRNKYSNRESNRSDWSHNSNPGVRYIRARYCRLSRVHYYLDFCIKVAPKGNRERMSSALEYNNKTIDFVSWGILISESFNLANLLF